MELEALEKFCTNNGIEYKLNEPMSFHTSFKIGGPADIFATVSSENQLLQLINETNRLQIKRFIVGKGSNLLVSDDGIEGIVISLAGINDTVTDGETVSCGAGMSLSSLCRKACENGLSGLEFAYGIPGSVGGALYMNAGAYGGEMADVVISARYVTEDGEISEIKVEDMSLGYRKSVFRDGGAIITNVKFGLKSGEKQEIKARMDDILGRRQAKQPLEYPSGGSTFKRPVGYFAGALIEKNGLKGACVGGAQVSEKHAGFVINKDNATCSDVKKLIEKVQNTVFAADGVKLETEIIFEGR